MAPAYLDHAATTPLRPEAREAMLPWLGDLHGNPSGGHAWSRRARQAVDEARDVVAACLGVEPGEVVFTSGGTEADNLAISGVLQARPGGAVCTAVEHHAVLRPVERAGGEFVAVHADGTVDLHALAASLDDRTSIVSVILVNGEVGTINDLGAVAAVVRDRAPQASLHTDAVQAASWLDVAGAAGGCDLISATGHKLGGPQGTGVLAVRRGTPLAPILLGGGQERERRSGTHNVAGIVGFAAALAAATRDRSHDSARITRLRDRLADGILDAVPGSRETVPRELRSPASCHVLLGDGIESEAVLVLLDDAGIAASAGSACASGALEPSHVLTAMGVDRGLARSALRLTLGWSSTEADVDAALHAIPAAVDRLRAAVA